MAQELHSLTFPITSGGTTTPTEFSLDYLARKDGVVDTAETLMADTAEDCEFTFRAVSGTGASKTEKVSGNSLVWNQLNSKETFAQETLSGITYKVENGTIIASGTCTDAFNIVLCYVPVVANHKYLLYTSAKMPVSASYVNHVQLYSENEINLSIIENETVNGKIGTATGSGNAELRVRFQTGNTYNFSFNLTVFDLTQIYGAGHEPATVAEFKADYPKDYYAHEPGKVINNSSTGIKSVGTNLWDEVTEPGYIDSSGGLYPLATAIRSKNFCKCIPNTGYYLKVPASSTGHSVCWYDANQNFIGRVINTSSVTSPSNAEYYKLSFYSYGGSTYNHDIQFALGTAADKTVYHPYKTSTLSLPITTLQGVPSGGSTAETMFADGMVRNGSVEDEMYPSAGTAVKRFAKQTVTGSSGDTVALAGCKTSATTYICGDDIGTLASGILTLSKTVSSVDVYYELATPTNYTFPPVSDLLSVEDGGTLEQLTPTGTEPTSAPFKGEMRFPVRINKQAIAVPAPTANGTYRLTCTVTNGVATYSWVSA